MLQAIVLAGGDSRRMGTPKALLPDAEGRPFVARIVRSLAAAGLTEIVVVTGAQHDAIAAALESDAPPVLPVLARNPDPSRGQLSSLWVGLDLAVRRDPEAVLTTLVDVPLVRAATISAVVDAWRRERAPIVRPIVGDRHGHPVVFDRAVFDDIRRARLDEGVKAVFRTHAVRVLNVPVPDQGCLVDVDTPADYEAMRRAQG
jgi:CTP:molybdopterin cytidylyltransferase MocA